MDDGDELNRTYSTNKIQHLPVVNIDALKKQISDNHETSEMQSRQRHGSVSSSQFSNNTSIKRQTTSQDQGRPSVNVAPIGPNQLSNGLFNIMSSIDVKSWKNIPEPVCNTTTGLLSCIDYLKRFVLFMD